MRAKCLSFLVLILAGNALAVERHAITHKDLWLMPRVGLPAISPDGQFVVYPMLEPSYKKDEEVADLWLVPTDGSETPRRITSGKGGESDPAWSNDSRRLAFSAKRGDDKKAQAYVLDLARGGEAQRVTRLSTGASAPRFSPDGTQLLFTSEVFAGSKNDADSERLAKEEKEKKYKALAFDRYPVRDWDHWVDGKQTRVFVQPIGALDARDLLAGSKLVQSAGFKLDKNSLRWTPDGRSIVFAASRNHDRSAWSFTNAELWQVDLAGGEPRQLTGSETMDAADSWSSPRFSRNGRTLFALVTPLTQFVYNADRIGVFDWPSMKPRGRITLPQGRQIAGFDIAPDGRSVDVLGEDAGQVKRYRAPASDAVAHLVDAPKAGIYQGISIGGARPTVTVASYQSATEPPEIVRLGDDGRVHRALTAHASSAVSVLDLPAVEHFSFKNERGQTIDNMLVRPPGFDPKKRYPLLVLMHGGPYSQWQDAWVLRWNYHLLSAPGYVLLLTNYVGSTSQGEAFAQAIQGDPLKGPADDVNAAADEAIRRYPFIDASRQCAGGASYGGHLANWLQGTTTRYRCLVSHAGLVNLETQWGTSDVSWEREVSMGGPVWEQAAVWREQNPIRFAANFRTPVLVTFGEKDFRVPLNNGLEYWTALQRQRVESRLVVFPDENHWILGAENSRHFYEEVHTWLARYLSEPTAAAK